MAPLKPHPGSTGKSDFQMKITQESNVYVFFRNVSRPEVVDPILNGCLYKTISPPPSAALRCPCWWFRILPSEMEARGGWPCFPGFQILALKEYTRRVAAF